MGFKSMKVSCNNKKPFKLLNKKLNQQTVKNIELKYFTPDLRLF